MSKSVLLVLILISFIAGSVTTYYLFPQTIEVRVANQTILDEEESLILQELVTRGTSVTFVEEPYPSLAIYCPRDIWFMLLHENNVSFSYYYTRGMLKYAVFWYYVIEDHKRYSPMIYIVKGSEAT